MSRVSIRCVDTASELATLAAGWNAVLAKSRTRNPFLTFEWMSTWWDVFGADDELSVLVAEEEGQILGIAPLYMETVRHGPGIKIPQLSLLGDKTVGSDFLDLIVVEGREGDVVPAMLSHLCDRPRWRRLSLRNVAEGAVCRDLLEKRPRGSALRFCSCVAFRCPYVRLPGSMAEFLATPDSTYKHSARRRLRRLSRRPDFECCLALPEGEIAAGVNDMVALHQERWHSMGMPSVFDSERLRVFYRQVAPRMQQRGWLELTVMKLEGAAIAALFGLVYEGTYYCLVNACGIKGFAVKAGNALMFQRIESFIGRGMEINFLRGEHTYKYQWGAVDRRTMNLCAWRGVEGWIAPSVLPTARGAARGIKRILTRRRHEPTRRLRRAPGVDS